MFQFPRRGAKACSGIIMMESSCERLLNDDIKPPSLNHVLQIIQSTTAVTSSGGALFPLLNHLHTYAHLLKLKPMGSSSALMKHGQNM